MATKLCCMFFTHYVKFPGFLYSVCYIKRKNLQAIGNILFPPVTMSIPMYTWHTNVQDLVDMGYIGGVL